jgi:hypothetical protein
MDLRNGRVADTHVVDVEASVQGKALRQMRKGRDEHCDQ